MQKKIIFNCLPPSPTINPSAAFSILKSFLLSHNIQSEIIYWNFSLSHILEEEKEKTDWLQRPIMSLLPYYSLLAEKYQDCEASNNIIKFYSSLFPEINITKDFDIKFLKIRKEIIKIINKELDKINFDEVLLWGISAKCFQWIPGLILAQEIKKRNKNTKIIFGGFSGIIDAKEILQSSTDIDFVIYGEGEYPLLELIKVLNDQTFNFSIVPRLIYREKEIIKESIQKRSEFLDHTNYPFPDYSDYIKLAIKKHPVKDLRFPINSIRSCRWKKCKFCNYSIGYKYRERSPESIISEIEYLYKTFNVYKFNFVDNDFIGKDLTRFEKLLDLLIESQNINDIKYSIWGQLILQDDLTAGIYKKMTLAGFIHVFAGYESISDQLLQKMDKNNRFAHNILYLKYCVKYGIKPDANIIRDIPGETADEVNENVYNLQYLRFYFHGEHHFFSHTYGNFTLYKETKFNQVVSKKEKINFNIDSFSKYLPIKLINEPFNIFGLMRHRIINSKEWEEFSNTEGYFRNNKHYYDLLKLQDDIYYREFLEEEQISQIIFNEPDYLETLILADKQVISFDDLKTGLQINYPNITDQRISKILDDLKAVFLLYASSDYSSIVSVLDMSLIN